MKVELNQPSTWPKNRLQRPLGTEANTNNTSTRKQENSRANTSFAVLV